MNELTKYISNTLINGTKVFDMDKKLLSKFINETLETSILKPKKTGLKFGIASGLSIGDDVALNFINKPKEIETSLLFYLINDFTLVDIENVKQKDGSNIKNAILYNKVLDKTFSLENVETNIEDNSDYKTRLFIERNNLYLEPLYKNSEIDKLSDIDYKIVNLDVTGELNNKGERLYLKINDKILPLYDYEIKLIPDQLIYNGNNDIFTFKVVFITGTIDKNKNQIINDDSPLCLGITPKNYDKLKTINMMSLNDDEIVKGEPNE